MNQLCLTQEETRTRLSQDRHVFILDALQKVVPIVDLLDLVCSYLPYCDECGRLHLVPTSCVSLSCPLDDSFLCDTCGMQCQECQGTFHADCIKCKCDEGELSPKRQRFINQQMPSNTCIAFKTCGAFSMIIAIVLYVASCNPWVAGGCPLRSYIPNATLLNITVTKTQDYYGRTSYLASPVYNYSYRKQEQVCVDLFQSVRYKSELDAINTTAFPRWTPLIECPGRTVSCITESRGRHIWIAAVVMFALFTLNCVLQWMEVLPLCRSQPLGRKIF